MEATKTLVRILTLLVLVGLLAGAGFWYYHYTARERQIRKLEEEKRHLEQIIQRITTERRLAEVIVTGSSLVDGVRETRLLFVEYARDQKTSMVPREFIVRGEMVHVDAMVIKFDRSFVFADDKLKGCSIALFTKIYGDSEPPEKAQTIDAPGAIPPIYAGADPAAAEFEQKLWQNFWKLFTDEAFRKEHGVRTAYGDGKWWKPEEGFLYTLSITADGGVTMPPPEPIRAIYREALKNRAGAATRP